MPRRVLVLKQNVAYTLSCATGRYTLTGFSALLTYTPFVVSTKKGGDDAPKRKKNLHAARQYIIDAYENILGEKPEEVVLERLINETPRQEIRRIAQSPDLSGLSSIIERLHLLQAEYDAQQIAQKKIEQDKRIAQENEIKLRLELQAFMAEQHRRRQEEEAILMLL